MTTSLRSCIFIFAFAIFSGWAGAADKNGFQYDVQKTVLDKADTRGSDVNISNLDRMMGLKVSLKNTTFKEMAPGEITWEILNRKYLTSTIEHSTGTEKLQTLKPSEKIDLTLGEANVRGYRDGAVKHVDELEWQITIKRDGKELLKVSSTKSFEMLAKRATKIEAPPPAEAKP